MMLPTHSQAFVTTGQQPIQYEQATPAHRTPSTSMISFPSSNLTHTSVNNANPAPQAPQQQYSSFTQPATYVYPSAPAPTAVYSQPQASAGSQGWDGQTTGTYAYYTQPNTQSPTQPQAAYAQPQATYQYSHSQPQPQQQQAVYQPPAYPTTAAPANAAPSSYWTQQAPYAQAQAYPQQQPQAHITAQYQLAPQPMTNAAPQHHQQFAPMTNLDADGPKQLIVNYLAPHVTSAQLHQLFAAFGPLDGARVIYDRNSGCPKGYGFVYYKHAACAAAAIEKMNGYALHGKWLKVGYSSNPLTLAGTTTQ